VPDQPGQITSDHGWNTRKHISFLKEVVARFQEAGIRTSLFVDPDSDAVEGAALTGTNRIELYTEPYATHFPIDREKLSPRLLRLPETAIQAGLELNAGHDLSLKTSGS
jgi:pyridoxine 5-phosphate synthase